MSKPRNLSFLKYARHILALCLLLVMLFMEYHIVREQVRTKQQIDSIIYICGQLRMLSQRTALLAGQLQNADSDDTRQYLRGELKMAFRLMEAFHQTLEDEDGILSANLNNLAIVKAMFRKPPLSIDQRMHAYGRLIEEVLQLSPQELDDGRPPLKAVLATGTDGDLLFALDQLLHQFESESQLVGNRFEVTQKGLLIVNLVTLLVISLLVFYPMVGKIRRQRAQLQRDKKNLEMEVTEHVKTIGILVESEARFRDIVENSQEWIWEFDKDLSMTYSNTYVTKLLGYQQEELIGKPVSDLMSPDGQKKFQTVVSDHAASGTGWKGEIFEWRHRDGSARWLESNSILLKDDQGHWSGFRGLDRDITAQIQAQQDLFQSKQMLEYVLNHIPERVFWKDRNCRFLGCNQVLANDAGLSGPEDIIGLSDNDLPWHADASRLQKDDIEVMETGIAKLNFEEPLTKAYGTKRLLKSSKVPLFNEKRQIIGVLGTFEDITSTKELEKQLQQAQKMEAVGVLAGGIAHDFNNILTAILGYADMASETLPEESQARQDLVEVLTAAGRAKDLVKQILAFSRQEDQDLKPIYIQTLVKEVIKLIRATLPSTIEIRPEIEESDEKISGNATQIHSILMNICTNAYHAMRENGGVLGIAVKPVTIDAEAAESNLDLKQGRYLKLSISDTGHGMDEETLKYIFDPFFTTKGVDEGTGMGLSVVHGIVKSLSGAISVISEPGKGTTFVLYFPCLASENRSSRLTESTEVMGRERILLVDDEEPIARIGKRGLERFGYNVTMKTSSYQALEAFREQPDEFDLVITDYTMPGMTGLDLASELLNIRPSVPIVLISGVGEAKMLDEVGKIGIRDFLMKPAVGYELAQAVRKTMEQKKADG